MLSHGLIAEIPLSLPRFEDTESEITHGSSRDLNEEFRMSISKLQEIVSQILISPAFNTPHTEMALLGLSEKMDGALEELTQKYSSEVEEEANDIRHIKALKKLKDDGRLLFDTNLKELLIQNQAVLFQPLQMKSGWIDLADLDDQASLQKLSTKSKSTIPSKAEEPHQVEESVPSLSMMIDQPMRDAFQKSGEDLISFLIAYLPSKTATVQIFQIYAHWVAAYAQDLNFSGEASTKDGVSYLLAYAASDVG
ncbi:hypothetical protein [Pontibacter sp. G13]|uniref:hypothetical protein n=1 Tax=Pontibacter sp. G13 TaxID=3074898 RepID=UPI00288AE316|nr:hypothetical protein [Pontibacter sp. G13]WNJ21462.1 hypothetical protein RJD25_13415 [Pontibacter sp. G13]